MDEILSTRRTQWKYIVVRFFAWGLGCGIGIGAILAVTYYISQRPKTWNSKALLASRVTMSPDWGTAEVPKDADFIPATNINVVFFVAELRNATGGDDF